jgi:hypothetical protein
MERDPMTYKGFRKRPLRMEIAFFVQDVRWHIVHSFIGRWIYRAFH